MASSHVCEALIICYEGLELQEEQGRRVYPSRATRQDCVKPPTDDEDLLCKTVRRARSRWLCSVSLWPRQETIVATSLGSEVLSEVSWRDVMRSWTPQGARICDMGMLAVDPMWMLSPGCLRSQDQIKTADQESLPAELLLWYFSDVKMQVQAGDNRAAGRAG